MGQQPDPTMPANPLDPFGLWKQTQDAALEAWSKSMTDAVNTSAYAETSGRMLDAYLTVSAPLRKIMEQTMAQVLAQMSLPSRGEVVSLAERLTNIEMRLDDLDARLDGIARAVERTAEAAAALATAAPMAEAQPGGTPARPAARTGAAASANRTGANPAGASRQAANQTAAAGAKNTSTANRRPAARPQAKAE